MQGRFLAAPLMTVWGDGFISRSVQRICLESASCIVIPSEAEGSFLHTGIASYVRQWKRGKPFCERSKKEQSARKISRYARNDGMVYIVLCETAEKGNPFAKGARKSRVQGRFLDYARNDGGEAADSMNLRF